MFTAYGSEHTRLRKLVAKAFTARRIATMRPGIERIVEDLLGELSTVDSTELRENFVHPLPIEVICGLFGVPAELRPDLRTSVDRVFSTDLTPEEALSAQQLLYQTLTNLVATKRENPAEDMTSWLISVRDDEDGSQLTETELIDTLLLLLGAGHETTVNLLDQAITAMLTHPKQLDLVKSGEYSWDDVVDETLRWQAPVANLPLRYAVEDIELEGFTIRKGEAILAGYAAAGRDPEQVSDPDSFDIERTDKEHLSFGHGVHFCLGAPLARMEATVALSALFDRFADLAFSVSPRDLQPLPSFVSNGHQELPVTLSTA